MIADEKTLNLVKMLFAVLTEKNLTLASCESLTGGLFGATVCSVPGASAFYRGGVITYVDAVKHAIGVSQEILDAHTAISKECAIAMAQSAQRLTGSDVCVSFTGNAGPTAQDGKPVGEVWIGIAVKDQANAIKYSMEGDRNGIREACVKEGLRLLVSVLSETTR